MLAVSGADQAPKVFQSTYGWPHHILTWWEGELELGKGLMLRDLEPVEGPIYQTDPVLNLLLTQRLGQGLALSWPQFPCLQQDQMLCCHPDIQMSFLECQGIAPWWAHTPGMAIGPAYAEVTPCRVGTF